MIQPRATIRNFVSYMINQNTIIKALTTANDDAYHLVTLSMKNLFGDFFNINALHAPCVLMLALVSNLPIS